MLSFQPRLTFAQKKHPKPESPDSSITWMRRNSITGELYPKPIEHGFFGVAPVTAAGDQVDILLTNCKLTDDGDVWWEGMDEPINHGIDGKGKDGTPESGKKD